jgi:hypothetical protein
VTADELLPEGAVLLHVGPFKTGTTAIQGALELARHELPEHGVVYPGKGRRAMRPGWAALGRKPRGRPPVRPEEWQEFCGEVHAAAGKRVCVSTEDFGSANPAQARRIVDDLGGDNVYVVAVSRRLDRLLPSQWQERIKSHDTHTYDQWLRAVLTEDPSDRNAKRFWASHDMVDLYQRWSSAVGRDRFRLVVSDDSDPELLPRLFERMLGLPDGLLRLAPYVNASMTWNGAELVRRLNEVFVERGWPDDVYFPVMQRGLMQAVMASPRTPVEERIPPLPAWAARRVEEIVDEKIERLRQLEVPVIGDVERLRPPASPDAVQTLEQASMVSMATAAAAAIGAIEGAVDLRTRTRRRARRELAQLRGAAAETLARTSGRQLARELGSRARRRLTRS